MTTAGEGLRPTDARRGTRWTYTGTYDNVSWRRDSARRRRTGIAAASWCQATFPRDPRVIARLTVTVVVAGAAYIRWICRSWRQPDRRRAVAAEEFRRAAERLGATWIKLGQIIAAGDGIFPDELTHQCRLLHDRVVAESIDQVERTLTEELGQNWRNYISLEGKPVAAASIAQTYRARLSGGELVLVKVQRRNIKHRIRADIRAVSFLAPWLVGRIPVAALANPPALIELFARCISEELDFYVEADNSVDVADTIERYGAGGVIVPRAHPELVRERVLVMEYVPGERIDGNLGATDRRGIVDTLIASLLEGVVLGGVFHGDLHPGNMAITADGKVVLYDFGIVGRLNDAERSAFMHLITGSASGNWRQQLDALVVLGALPGDGDLETLGRELGLDQAAVNPANLSAEELSREAARIARVLLDAGSRLPVPLMLWGKNLAFLDHTIGRLCPEVDIVDLVAGTISSFIQRHSVALVGTTLSGAHVNRQAIADSLAAENGHLRWEDVRRRREIIVSRQAARDMRASRWRALRMRHGT